LLRKHQYQTDQQKSGGDRYTNRDPISNRQADDEIRSAALCCKQFNADDCDPTVNAESDKPNQYLAKLVNEPLEY
jgi:hypothetical protein